MHFLERIEVPVSLEEAWEFLWQVPRVAACLPGCIGVDERESRKAYTAHFRDHIGPYRVQFDLDVQIVGLQAKQSLRLLATGRDARLGITQRVALSASLVEVDRRATAIDLDAEVEVLGKVATLGQFAVKRKAKEVVAQFAANVARELEAAEEVNAPASEITR